MRINNMRIAVFGATGWVGSEVSQYLERFFTVEKFAYYEISKLRTNPSYFNVIINCAGLVGNPNVAAVQGQIDELRKANVDLPQELAEIAGLAQAHLIHLSSGCLYDKYKQGQDAQDNEISEVDGWIEEDEPNFDGSDYVISKRNGEIALKNYERVTILRPRMPFNDKAIDKNLLIKLAKYTKGEIVNAYNTITPMSVLVNCIFNICEQYNQRDTFGTFNLCSLKPVPTSLLMETIAGELNLDYGVTYTHPDEFNAKHECKRSFTSICSKKAIDNGIVKHPAMIDPMIDVSYILYMMTKIPGKRASWQNAINS